MIELDGRKQTLGALVAAALNRLRDSRLGLIGYPALSRT